MATAALASDQLHIDRINPYTWSGTFGVSHDGFPKYTVSDGKYVSQIDETPMTIDANEDTGAFTPLHINRSGAQYLMEGTVNPAPYREFPARKYEFDDGTTTWDRPGRSLATLIKKDETIWLLVLLVVAFWLVKYLKFR